jgi:Flp pilus assembly protein TadG
LIEPIFIAAVLTSRAIEKDTAVPPFVHLAHSFARDTRGSIAVIFGVILLAIMLACGLALDVSRAYNVHSKIQEALDAAALAAAKLLDEEGASDSDVQAIAKAFFDERRANMRMDGLELGSFTVVANRAQSSVTVRIDASLPSIFGKIGGTSPAFKFTPVATATYDTKKIEMAMVLDITGSMAPNGKMDALKTAAKEVVDTLFAGNPSPGAVRTALIPYSASVNAGAYFDWVTFAHHGGPHGDTCVVERAGGDAYTDALPTAGTYLGTSSPFENPRYSCPPPAVVPLTDLSDSSQRAAFKAKIDALVPTGATAGHIGTAWGWYTLSPTWASLWPSSSRPKPYSKDIVKVVILMTDGEFNTSYENGNVNSTDFTAVGSSGYQALELCKNIQAPGIMIFTVAFQAPANAGEMLKQCSGPANFYDADSKSELVQAFRDIVDKLTNLRISS